MCLHPKSNLFMVCLKALLIALLKNIVFIVYQLIINYLINRSYSAVLLDADSIKVHSIKIHQTLVRYFNNDLRYLEKTYFALFAIIQEIWKIRSLCRVTLLLCIIK